MTIAAGEARVGSKAADRWPARPVLGALLRIAIVVVPIAVGLVVAIVLTHTLPGATSTAGRILWWTAVLAGSTVALLLTDRLARRTLPLAVLLDLSLVFPGKAPSRMRSAGAVSVRELERRLVALRADGADSGPLAAAETLVTLVGILGVHDPRTRGHSERVRAFTDMLTAELGLDEDARVRIRWAALVHDIGKLTVPGTILNGGTDLSESEWDTIRQHPHEGHRLASGLMPWLGEWGRAVVEHHERWDGTGYPHGLAGEQIGYGARIITVADAFDTMTAARSYNKARTAAAAREELARCAGSHFDPQVVRAFLALSIRRVSWVLGPVTWLAQLPFVVAADRAGRVVKTGVATAAVAGLVVVGAAPGPGAVHPSRPPAVALAPVPTVPPSSTATSPPVALAFTDDVAGSSPAAIAPSTSHHRVAGQTAHPAAGPTPRPVVRVPASPPSVPPAGSPPVHSRPTVAPPAASPPTVTPPAASPPTVTPTATPTVLPPSPAPVPGPATKVKHPKKGKNAGHGNGHFGKNAAAHARPPKG